MKNALRLFGFLGMLPEGMISGWHGIWQHEPQADSVHTEKNRIG